ncbi:hypothetical protein M431DRAFT_478327 [Trichoderma harzianum CBS 226.95]|uniref:Uncharacterized protein n=1 Tax=Trichoderma harzianum CBS 226.95 TaxID=983964 RepID=A0A2T4AQ83_TRIHA|nr:hypothetical protein M431DRAFT_478327 [Trichoderma harzianum CBS 226.95]PTB59222.1 hypothetical protein M431DRAFT_478327 [Trichoderma harzianum CBS 226.95]
MPRRWYQSIAPIQLHGRPRYKKYFPWRISLYGQAPLLPTFMTRDLDLVNLVLSSSSSIEISSMQLEPLPDLALAHRGNMDHEINVTFVRDVGRRSGQRVVAEQREIGGDASYFLHSVSYWVALLAVHKTPYSGNTSGLAYQIGSSLTSPRKKSSDRRLSCFYTAKVPPFQSHDLGILGDVDSEVTLCATAVAMTGQEIGVGSPEQAGHSLVMMEMASTSSNDAVRPLLKREYEPEITTSQAPASFRTGGQHGIVTPHSANLPSRHHMLLGFFSSSSVMLLRTQYCCLAANMQMALIREAGGLLASGVAVPGGRAYSPRLRGGKSDDSI